MLIAFDPIFPDTFYHLFHYEFDAAGTFAENNNPVQYEDAIHCHARRLPQDSLLPLIH
ncbi:Uncharacterised protein [Providencia rettgeri]|uniref:Uncharacterized protein n=1 Tax=Providencia rettgeri TaxID=587 RepID=A0A379FTU0_PRORE|nr:Uncharacterised protein [Providencia rettgeri]